MIDFTINTEYENMRLDRFVQKNCTSISKMSIQKMMRKGRIKINGKKPKPDTRIHTGDHVKIFISTSDKKERPPKPNVPPPEILYEENDFIAVNKPAGLVSHPSKGSKDSLSERIYAYLYDNLDKEGTFVPGVINRLDTNTSGIVLAPKTPLAAQKMYALMRENKIKKSYCVLAKGRIEKKLILKTYAKKNKKENKMYPSNISDKNAVFMHTIFTPIEYIGGNTLLKAKLLTGKTHQIRFQLYCINHPVAGDPKYKDENFNRFMYEKYHLNRQFLHCYEMSFPFWQDQSIIKITSTYSDDLDKVYKKLKQEQTHRF